MIEIDLRCYNKVRKLQLTPEWPIQLLIGTGVRSHRQFFYQSLQREPFQAEETDMIKKYNFTSNTRILYRWHVIGGLSRFTPLFESLRILCFMSSREITKQRNLVLQNCWRSVKFLKSSKHNRVYFENEIEHSLGPWFISPKSKPV